VFVFSLIALATAVVLAVITARWALVALTLALEGAISVYLVANDGWYGAGWGEFDVALNAVVERLLLAAAALGVALRKQSRRNAEATNPPASPSTGHVAR
jgi:hypothetical protein